MGSITSGLAHLSGWAAYAVVAALVFGETAVFLGFVLPGEAAVVLGGVLASRGHVSIVWLVIIVVLAAVLGPLAGYEVGRRWATGCSPPARCAGSRAACTGPGRRCRPRAAWAS